MVEFLHSENRDAGPAIRGYVYQVDRTILHWLDLGPGQILELERGEDIDVVHQDLANGAEQNRLLEQVKSLTGSITLRTSAVAA
ncbi:MAG: hypothetical protein J7M14_03305, partial [Planctomycetes bacterium]|nr:hypothetical protein [Planctomycetota bacterium]